MRKIILVFSIMAFFMVSMESLQAQQETVNGADALLKEALYKANKVKVSNFSSQQFDALFFEFFDKKANSNVLLTKEEFYKYTIQIAIYSDRLAALYPDQIAIAAENKKKWFAETYEDYLLSKATQKK